MLIRPGSLPITSTYASHAPDPVAAARPNRIPAPQITPSPGAAHPENDPRRENSSHGGGYANNNYKYIRRGDARTDSQRAHADSLNASATYASAPQFHKTGRADSIAEQKRATRKIDPKKPSGPRPSFDQTTLEAEYARQRSEGLTPPNNYRPSWSAVTHGTATYGMTAQETTALGTMAQGTTAQETAAQETAAQGTIPSQPPKNARLQEMATPREQRIPPPDTGIEQTATHRKSTGAPAFFVTQPTKSSHKVDISV